MPGNRPVRSYLESPALTRSPHKWGWAATIRKNNTIYELKNISDLSPVVLDDFLFLNEIRKSVFPADI